MRLTYREYGVIIFLLLLVTWLGARKLNADGIWADEWWSIELVSADVLGETLDVGQVVERVSRKQVLGLLYPILLAGWGQVVGWSVWALRALSLFLGVLAVAVVFRLGIAFSRKTLVAIGAAALMGTSAWFVYYLHEIRMYTLYVLMVALFLLLYHQLMTRLGKPRTWMYLAFGLVTAGLLHSHYYGALLVAVVGVWHLLQLLRRPADRHWWLVSGAAIVGAAAFVPWVVNAVQAVEIVGGQTRAEAGASMMWQLTHETLYIFSNTNIALFALLALFSLNERRSWIVWALLIPLFILDLLTYNALSINELRYHMAVLPLLAIVTGFGLNQLALRRVSPVIFLSMWLVGLFAVQGDFRIDRMIQRWPDQPIREMADVLRGPVQPEDAIINLVDVDYIPELAQPGLVYYMMDIGARLEIVENRTYPGLRNFESRMQEAIGDADRVWLIGDPRWEIDEWLLTEYLLLEQEMYRCATLAEEQNMRVQAYGRVSMNNPRITFADSVSLQQIGPAYVHDGVLYAWLAYDVAETIPPDTYSVALHVTLDGTVLAQMDYGLPYRGRSCRLIQIPVNGLPEAEYELRVAVYDWRTGERLSVTAPNDNQTNYPLLQQVSLES